MRSRVAIVGFLVILSLAVSTAYAGNVIVRNGQLNVSGGFYSNSDTLHVDSVNNRVGIGTTSPSAKLDVEGNLDLSNFNITDVASISGGGKAVNFADDINLSMNDLLLSDPNYNSSILLAGTSAGTNKPALAINVQPADPVNENAAVRVFRTGDVKDYGEFIVVEPNVGTIRFRMRSYKAGQGTSYLGLENATNLYVDGNVGIGTVSPSTKFHVDFDGAGPYTDSTLNGTLFLESGGSVGEGNYGSGIIFGQVDGNSAVNVGAAIYGIQTGSDSNEMGLGFDIHTSSSGDNRSNAMVIGHNSYVGIGTASPAQRLTVQQGDILINGSGTSNPELKFADGGGLKAVLGYVDSGDTLRLGHESDVTTTDDLVIDGSGRVGIGTSTPGDLFEVGNGTSGVNVTLRGALNTPNTEARLKLLEGDTSAGFEVLYDGDSNYFKILSDNGAGTRNDRLVIQRDTGKVGIGTSVPGANLHVMYADGHTGGDFYSNQKGIQIRNTNETAGTYAALSLEHGNDGWLMRSVYQANNDENLQFLRYNSWASSDGSVVLHLDNSGNVGIGTILPGQKLEVFDDSDMYQMRLTGANSKSMDIGVDGNGFSRVNSSFGFGVMRGTTEIMRIGNNDDHVGIGTVLPASKLHVSDPADNDILLLNDSDGSCEAQPESGGLTWSCSSDARLKTDIQDAADALDYVCSIPIRDYTVIASGENMTGVVAQEVLEDYPELVSVNVGGYYMVSEVGHWKLVKALQDLRREKDAEIDELTELNEELISMNERLMEELCERDPTYSWCSGSTSSVDL